MLSISTGTNSRPEWVCGRSLPSPTVHILPPDTDEILPLQNFCIDEKRSYSLNTSEPRAPRLQMTLNDRDFSQSSSGEDTEIEFRDNAVVTSVPSKCRTRRPNVRPIVKGNNLYGRKGKLRCLQCRKWRQKCIYEDPKLPCTVCSQKGLTCGEEEKVLARHVRSVRTVSGNVIDLQDTHSDGAEILDLIPWGPPTPIDQTLCGSDALYMEFYWCTSGTWFDLTNDRTTDATNPFAVCTVHRFGPHISSNLVRSAILFYSTFRKDHSLSYLGMMYLAQFYEYAKEAIEQGSYVELVYGCYIMCLTEMACRRRLFGDFEKHANGFLMSYRKVVHCALTIEEHDAISRAYTLLTQMIRIPRSRWHDDETWDDFLEAVNQRMDSATSRSVVIRAPESPSIQPFWIPPSHYLFVAQDIVYQLCTLFNRLSRILKNTPDGRKFSWNETAVSVECALNRLENVLNFVPPTPLDSKETSPQLLLLDEGPQSIPRDQYKRELLTVFYVFRLQYFIMVREWSDLTCSETLGTALAIGRLYPPSHESHFPAEMRFIVNRGIVFALILAADSKNVKGRLSLKYYQVICSEPEHSSKVVGGLYVPIGIVLLMSWVELFSTTCWASRDEISCLRHGHGVFTDGRGSRLEGIWVNDQFQNQCLIC